MDKQCSVCGDIKDIEDFSWKIKKKGTRQHHCKECQNKYNGNHYTENSDRYIGKAVERAQNNKLFVYELKDNKPCADCKVVHRHFALDYDHRDPKTKVMGIAEMLTYSKEAILKEIAKCDLVCANCHRYRTFKRNPGNIHGTATSYRADGCRCDICRAYITNFNKKKWQQHKLES